MKQRIGWTIYRLTRPLHRPFVHKTRRSRVVIINNDKVLLVRTFLGSPEWKLPGGGIKKGEEESVGAVREISEELAINLDPAKLAHLVDTRVTYADRYYTAVCFGVKVNDLNFRRNRLELTAAKWFPINKLPENRHTTVDKALASWQQVG